MSVPTYYVCPHLSCLSPPIMSLPTNYVCPHLLCLSPPIMSVPTYYVCPNLSCLSPHIMSVPSFHVRPHLLCLFPPIISFADKPFLNLDCLGNVRVCLECYSRVFGQGLEGSIVSLSLRKGHCKKIFRNPIFGTLGSILDFQLS